MALPRSLSARSQSPAPGYANQSRPNSRGRRPRQQPTRARSIATSIGEKPAAGAEQPGERVTVGVRIRPLLERERAKVHSGCSAWIEPPNRVVLQDPQTKQGRTFECDFAFDSTDPSGKDFAGQKVVYDAIGSKIVAQTLDGYNSCLLAYGQTGTGKTYTIIGDYAGHVEEYGLLPRIADNLFAEISQLKRDGTTVRVQASYVEIYNGQLADLLVLESQNQRGHGRPPLGPGQANAPAKTDAKLVIHTHPDVGVYVENLSELAVSSAEEVHGLLVAGARRRHTAKTSMNDRSSRSHTVFSLKVELRNVGEQGSHRMATAQVVDLAGRENEESTEVTGERLKELTFINRSLFQLANCISALTQASREHIPFRNSKLTMLVSESFHRNSRTCLLAALTPAETGYDENLLTCRFLESARKIVTKPLLNEFSSDDLKTKLEDEVVRIQRQLGNLEGDSELVSRQAMLKQISRSWGEYEEAMARFIAEQPDNTVAARQMRQAMLTDVCAVVGRTLDGASVAVQNLEKQQVDIGSRLGHAESQLSAVEARVQKLRQKRAFSVPAKQSRAQDRVQLPPVIASERGLTRNAGSAPSVTVSISLPPVVVLH
mmetsp:Transcript_12217/g.27661  ORF Transcript_12217/g.27661 Transcript_12217/m.27661 type:complete len:602 (-) Transcript_12217:46-1851(-)